MQHSGGPCVTARAGVAGSALRPGRASRPGAEADRGRTALLATISHDLCAPLAAARAAVSALRSRDIRLTTDDRDELLAAAAESLDLLSSLVENLLDASRLRPGRWRSSPAPRIWVRSWPRRCAVPGRRREP